MGTMIAFICGAALFYLSLYFPACCGLFSSILIGYWILKKRAFLIFILIIGALYAFYRYTPPLDKPSLQKKEIAAKGRFIPNTRISNADKPLEMFMVGEAIDAKTGENIPDLNDQEIMLSEELEPDFNTEYEILLKTGKDKTRSNPGGFSGQRIFARALNMREAGPAGFSLRGFIDLQRDRLNRKIRSLFKADAAALVIAVTTGEMSYLSDEVRNAFSATGLSHILSISGTHFGLFSVVLFGIFSFLIRRLPYHILLRVTLYLSPSQAGAILSMPFMIIYLAISGASPPALRSFLMIGLFLLGLIIGRKGFWLNSLLFAAVVLVIWDPEVILNLSSQLSFLAVLSIGLVLEKDETKQDEKKERKTGDRIIRWLSGPIMVTLAASAGTAPLVLYHFHYLSLVSPLANLVATPLIGFILVFLGMIAAFSFLFTSHYVLAPLVGLTAEYSISLVKLISGIPFADLKMPAFPPALVIFFYIAVPGFLISGRKRTWISLALVPFLVYVSLAFFAKKELIVTFLDVGQGDSSVVELPTGKTLVIDTGRTGREAAAFLKARGKRTIDALVLSHIHPDHTGGLEYLINNFEVKEIWSNGMIAYPEGPAQKIRKLALARGDVINSGGCTITVLHPYPEFRLVSDNEYSEENAVSLVFRLSCGLSSFLFTGDIEEEAQEDIAHLGSWIASDVIKIPHHGSRTSADQWFFNTVAPSAAVISVGRDNSFGHPSPEMIETLANARTFRTDRDGAVRITDGLHGLEFRTFREVSLERVNSPGKEWANIKRLFVSW